jgi:hypothetical protein
VDYYKTATRLIRIYGAVPGCIPIMDGRALPPLPPFEDFPTSALADQLLSLRQPSSSRTRVRILPDLPVSAIVSDYQNRLQPQDYFCVSPWTVMYVTPSGEVYPCLNYRVGNLREEPLRKLWNYARFLQFRLRVLHRGLFADCRGCCDLLLKAVPGYTVPFLRMPRLRDVADPADQFKNTRGTL